VTQTSDHNYLVFNYTVTYPS